jgi:membrane dipeptidase
VLIIDAHLDLAYNALRWQRDLTRSVHTLRAQESGVTGPGWGQGTVALPELRRGRVALCFATTLARSTGRPAPGIDYPAAAQAHAAARGHLAYYRALETQGEARVITGADALDTHMAEWGRWEADGAAAAPPPLGLVPAMESADPILAPGDVADWWAAGIRVIGPSHYGPGRYAGGTGTELGLSGGGRDLLRAMDEAGVALDVTHLADVALDEALTVFRGPVLASHCNCRALVPVQRQLDDGRLKALIERDAVIGAALDVWMLKLGWTRAAGNAGITLDRVADHIDHVCQLAGDSRHAAIGSDLDGGFGREQSPADLDSVADLQRIAEILAARGYAAADIAAVMHGNWLALLRRAWRC